MDNTDIQALLDEMLKKQEAALRKQFEEREKKLIELYEQREKNGHHYLRLKPMWLLTMWHNTSAMR